MFSLIFFALMAVLASGKKFTEEMAKLGIRHKHGGAHNHQSQSLVECGIKSLKKLYQKLDSSIRSPVKLQYAVMSLNNMVRVDGSGSAAQMFFGRTPRTGKFGLVVSQSGLTGKELAEARSKSHRLMRDRTKGSRRIETFQKNDRVLLQDEKSGKFSHKAIVINPRDRKSDDPKSYYIRKDDSGEVLLRNRRHFKRLPIQASEAPNTGPQLQNQGQAEPRTRSEHARAERESLQADSAAERPQ